MEATRKMKILLDEGNFYEKNICIFLQWNQLKKAKNSRIKIGKLKWVREKEFFFEKYIRIFALIFLKKIKEAVCGRRVARDEARERERSAGWGGLSHDCRMGRLSSDQ